MKTLKRICSSGRLLRLSSAVVLCGFILPRLARAQEQNKNGVSATAISVPSGPGTIEGLGEAFQPALNTGTGKHAISIQVPPGPAGLRPSLVLFYEGGGGNGPLGYGWQLPVPFVQRQSDKGAPLYVDAPNGADDDLDGTVDEVDEIDTYIADNSEELVPVSDLTETSYFCKNESGFLRYRRVGNHWEAKTPQGTRLVFGESETARIVDPSVPGRVFRWLLERSVDSNGNEIRYAYSSFPGTANLAQKYLSHVSYGAGPAPWGGKFHFVAFEYEDRTDWFEDCRAGFPLRTGKRLAAVRVGTQGIALPGHAAGDFNKDSVPDALNRRYRIDYLASDRASLVSGVTVFGADDVMALPRSSYEYTMDGGGTNLSASGKILSCINEPPVGFDNANVDFCDLNGDGLPDLLRADGSTHRAYLNLGEGAMPAGGNGLLWSSAVEVAAPSVGASPWPLALSNSQVVLSDVDGDGMSDFVQMSGSQTYFFRNTPQSGQLPSWGQRTALTAVNFVPPSPYGTDGAIRVFDLDFDKRSDIVRSQSSGGAFIYQVWFNRGATSFSERTTFSPTDGFDFTDASVKTADLNGDRLTDIARVRTSSIECTMSLGNGRFLPKETIPLADAGLTSAQMAAAALEDVTGDGLADLVLLRPSPGTVWIWPNRGNRTFGARITVTGLPAAYFATAKSRWADINGNGTTDLVLADSGSVAGERIRAIDLGRLTGCEPKPYLLRRVDNGIGRVEEIVHTTTTEFLLADGTPSRGGYSYSWPHPLPFPVTVIKEIHTSDSLGGTYTTRFRYHDGYYDPEEKQFRGFARVEQIDVGDVTAPTLVSTSSFDVGDVEEVRKGCLLRMLTADEQGGVFQDSSTTWAVRNLHSGIDGRNVRYSHRQATTTDILEQGRGTPRRTYAEYSYDDYGNQTVERNYGLIEGGNLGAFNDERITSTDFALNRDAWLLRFPKQVEIRDFAGTVVNRTRTYYDDPDFGGGNYGAVTVGNPTMVRKWTDVARNDYVAASRTRYDAYGNPVRSYDALWTGGAGHWREITFDPDFHAYPDTETIHVDGSVASLTMSATYDPGFGTMLTVEDFNRNITRFAYDALARPVKVIKPFDTAEAPTIEYDYSLAVPVAGGGFINFTEIRQRETAGGGQFLSREFFDGLGRKRLVKHEDRETGKFVAKEQSTFNARRGVRAVSNPYQSDHFDYAAPPDGTSEVRTDYDASGRALQVTQQDGTSAATVYEPLVIRSFDENDRIAGSPYFDTPMVHHNDGLGRLVRVDEVVKIDDEGRSSGSINTWTTRYTYRADDLLLTLRDSQDNFKEFRYDALGRKVFMDDPNRGEMHWRYDAASNLLQSTDHKGQVIRMTYDGANRLLTEDLLDEGQPYSGNHAFDPGQTVTVANRPDVAWFYDTPVAGLDLGNGSTGTASNTLGQIAYVWDLSGEEHFSYDARGRTSWQVKRLADPSFPGPLASYRTGYSYDSADRLVTLDYPDGDHVTHRYNNRLELERILGGPSGTIVSGIDYKPWDSLASCTYGNGTSTRYDYDSRLRLRNLVTTGPGNASLVSFSYQFDGVGNIDRITDRRSIDGPRQNTQIFSYDSLYRITGVTYPGQGGAGIQYRFDRLGNMLEQSSSIQHTDRGLSVANLGLMSYGGSAGRSGRAGRGDSAAGPHALTSVAADGGRSYSYDRNGNMTVIDGMDCSWDFKDRMVATADAKMTARYVYDHSDRRVAKHVTPKPGQPNAGTTDSTFYINRYFEIRPGEPPVKYVWNGETRVARITGTVESDQRVQRLRLRGGWNLAGLEVAAPAGSFDPATNPDVTDGTWWDRSVPSWKPLPAAGILPAGTPLWLKSRADAILPVAGPRAPPMPLSLDAGELRYAANPAGVSVPLSSIPETWEIWRFDAATQRWQTRFIGDLAIASDVLPTTWQPGEALLLKASNGSVMPVSLDPTLEIRYYHQDHLGSTSVVTDAKGELVEETANYPFGVERSGYRPKGIGEAYGFTQKERDGESGLHYFEARFVVGLVSRFSQVDMLAESSSSKILRIPQLFHPYAYALNRPHRMKDPSGMVPFDLHWDVALTKGLKFQGFYYGAAAVCFKADSDAEVMMLAAYNIGPMMGAGPNAKAAMNRFLDTSWGGENGRIYNFDMQKMINESKLEGVIASKIRDQLNSCNSIQKHSTSRNSGRISIGQGDFKNSDWQFTIGGHLIRWNHNQNSGATHLSTDDPYDWDPFDPSRKETIQNDLRVSDCVHQSGCRMVASGKAANYINHGDATIYMDPSK